MNYINKGKRDVIIIPEFSKVQIIEAIREKYDDLYGIVPPHITLGCTKELIELSLDEEFETVVDQLSVELIGENEESNIIIQVEL